MAAAESRLGKKGVPGPLHRGALPGGPQDQGQVHSG